MINKEKKWQTFKITCFFCRSPFGCKARDSYHITRLHCGSAVCFSAFKRQGKEERAEYNEILKKIKKEAIPLEGKRPYVRKNKKTPLPPLMMVNNKIIRKEDGIDLGDIVDQDEYFFYTQKGGKIVQYRKNCVIESQDESTA